MKGTDRVLTDLAAMQRHVFTRRQALNAGATRTVIELLGRVSENRVGNAIDSATRMGRTTPTVVRRRLGELGRQGRRGIELFERVMECQGVQSWVERQFLRLVVAAGVPNRSGSACIEATASTSPGSISTSSRCRCSPR